MGKGALFICLGNICRSPIAEAVFSQVIKERGITDQWKVDSAALGGWHEGNPPDSRALKVLRNHNISYNGRARQAFHNTDVEIPDSKALKVLRNHNISYNGRARQIEDVDYNQFDYVFGMDMNNISNLRGQQPPGSKAKVLLLGDFDPEGDKIIRDPYYDSGSEGFEKCYQQCVRSCNAFLDQLEQGNI